MPAITVGVAEVEERLRQLRRRVNSRTALHVGSIGLSVVLLVAAGLLVLALRGSPLLFRTAVWSALLLVVVTVSIGVMVTRRRWLNLTAAASLADRHGNLTQRLVTLMDLRQRPRPSRFGPVLVAQILALGARWDPRRIAPRRVPRTVLLPLAALLVLATTALLEQRAPAAAPPAATAHSAAGAAQAGAQQPWPQGTDQTPATGQDAAAAGQNAPGERRTGTTRGAAAPDGTGTQSSAAAARDGQTQDPPRNRPAPQGDGGQETRLAALPDRLQNTLRQALQGDGANDRRGPSTRPETAQQGDRGAQGTASAPAAAGRTAGQTDPRNATPPASDAARREPTTSSDPGRSKGRPQRRDGEPDAPQQSSTGGTPSKGAGRGSSPGGLLGTADPDALAGAGTKPQPFTLTITSFLHATDAPAPLPKRGRAEKGPVAGAGGTPGDDNDPTDGADTTLADDALRRAAIPPAYAGIVRRVYLPTEAP